MKSRISLIISEDARAHDRAVKSTKLSNSFRFVPSRNKVYWRIFDA